MGIKMQNAPVFYTLAQVRFNPILEMNDFIPHIQEKLRRVGFPDFRREVLHQLELRQIDGEQNVQTHGATRWSFMNARRTEGYLIHTDFIVFHTTAYDTSPAFFDRLLQGLQLVHESIGLAYIERIGLRYLDAVSPGAGQTIKDYLNSSVIGLYGAVQGDLARSFVETVVQNKPGTLVSRILIRKGTLAIPPDLQPVRLEIANQFTSINGMHAILDNDQFAAERSDVNLEEVKVKLDVMHDRIDEAFRTAVTPFALDQWKYVENSRRR